MQKQTIQRRRAEALTNVAARLAKLRPWRRAGAAFLAGSFCALGLPPVGFFPALWFGFPVLIWLLGAAANKKQAFALGWCFAFGYFLFGLYWIAAAMFVDLARFGWMVPFTVAGLPAILGCYYGLAALAWRRLGWRGLGGAGTLAALFGLAEYLRGMLFSGFPWNLFGYVWADILPVAQSVSLIGSYGLTLLTLLAACLPAALPGGGRRAAAANLAALGLFALLGTWGAARLHGAPTEFLPETYVRLVQPVIAQSMKWEASARERNLQNLLNLTAAPSDRPLTHVIWPETAVPYFLENDLPHRMQIAAAMPAGSMLITGGLRGEEMPDNTRRYFNALLTMDHSGAIVATYNKFHLVPFGEYVPFRQFGPIAAAAAGFGEFAAGPGPRSLHVPGLPAFSPLICYEIIFPRAVTDLLDPPKLLVNVTNDAWYGRTSGPYQHLAIARMRAVEEGIPLLRAANNGISAVVDAYGRAIKSMPLDMRGSLDSAVPKAAAEATLYSRHGDLITGFLWFTACLLCWFDGRKGKKQS